MRYWEPDEGTMLAQARQLNRIISPNRQSIDHNNVRSYFANSIDDTEAIPMSLGWIRFAIELLMGLATA